MTSHLASARTLLALAAIALNAGCGAPEGPPFSQRATDLDAAVRGEALCAATQADADANPNLLFYIARYDPEPELRECAYAAFLLAQGPELHARLASALKSKDERDRIGAAVMLDALDPSGACPVILEAWVRGFDASEGAERALTAAARDCRDLLPEYGDVHPYRMKQLLDGE